MKTIIQIKSGFSKSIAVLLTGLFATFQAVASCELGNGIKHVVVIAFDNFDSKRNTPNVPSDLEQVPSLNNFITQNGVLFTNHYTQLTAFTNPGFYTIITGLYPDRHGQVGNDVRFFRPDNTSSQVAAFTYWTTKIGAIANNISPENNSYLKIGSELGSDGKPKNTPAPWVAFTRAGCDVGTTYDGTVINIPGATLGDIRTVFGPASPEATEASGNAVIASANYSGLAVHCSQGSTICNHPNAVNDVLPDEPGGYSGFKALHGFKYLKSVFSPGDELRDINGNIIRCYRTGCFVNNAWVPGYPGPRSNELTAEVSLGLAATMLEQGVPVYFGRVDAAHSPPGPSFPPTPPRVQNVGPGTAPYQAKLATMEIAFSKFFARLEKAGINRENTLFVFTVEEEDQFVGAEPVPENCDGVSTLCSYSTIGPSTYDYFGQLAAQGININIVKEGGTTTFGSFVDGRPGANDLITRNLARAIANVQYTDFYTMLTSDVTFRLVDETSLELLHMKTSDPYRTPTLTHFDVPRSFPSYILAPPAPVTATGNAYAHGYLSPIINKKWLGMVGPGVRRDGGKGGIREDIWSDAADIRPTMMALLGLKDGYQHQGRVMVEALYKWALPKTLAAHYETINRLGVIYKQINAPLGELPQQGMSLVDKAMRTGNANEDSFYQNTTLELKSILIERDAIASQIETILFNASFNNRPLNQKESMDLIDRAEQLMAKMRKLQAP